MCWDFFLFSTAQGTQAPMLAINISFFTHKSRQAGGGRERRVREKQCRLRHNLLKSTFLWKKSTLSLFTVKIPGSRDRKEVWRSQSCCWIVWHPFTIDHMTAPLMLARCVSVREHSCALWTESVGLTCDRATQDANVSASGELSLARTWLKIYRGVHKWCLQISITYPDAVYWNALAPRSFRLVAATTVALDNCTVLLFPAKFSWAGGKPQMSTWRRLRKCRGSSPSKQKHCPLVLCCCKSPDCKSPRQTVYDPRCENLPGLQQKLVWHQTLLRVCPVVKTNGFN